MAERQSRRRKKRDEGQAEKPTDEETAVAKHLRFNLATKTSNIMGHKVEYFTGSKAVDMMLDSKWASGKGNTDILFTDRASVVQYLDRLLQKGMFYRALKVVKKSKKDDKKEKEAKKEEKVEKDVKKEESKSKKEKGDKKQEKETKEKLEKETTEKEEGTPKSKKSKEGKRKIKLEPTDEQVFRDGNDAYVWIYDPIKPMYYVYGLLLVVGAIAVCLFPLWPPWMRAGTYYLSIGGAGVVGSILALAIVRFILFVLLWMGTLGRLHLWIFPNLLADVGILESFQPTYQYTINKPDSTTSKDEASPDDEDKSKQEEEKAEAEKQPEEIAAHGDEEGEEEDGDEQNQDEEEEEEEAEEGEEEGSGSSSNPDHREEFEFIEPEDISAASEEPES